MITLDQQARFVRWIKFHNPEALREHSISKRQRLALTMMQSGGPLTSTSLAHSFPGCSVRDASRMLSDLESKGYATRTKKPNPTETGGFVYEYRLADALRYDDFRP